MNNKQCQNIAKVLFVGLARLQNSKSRLYLEEIDEFINSIDFNSNLEFESLYKWESEKRTWKQTHED